LDIRNVKEWYDKEVPKLGDRFKKITLLQINTLKTNATIYSVRYKNVRCMLIQKSPFLVHFTVDETNGMVEILAVIHTSRSPEIWLK
jgi:mRNA-degrading endonuclease RelE of RelBE toxin-antitoxin system